MSSANLFEISLDCTNIVVDKIEKSQVIFNHEFYDVLVEIEDIVDGFELVCRTDDKVFSFTVPKNELIHSELPLDKIYASEQIKRAEKYIAVRLHDGNEGYKEEIVEIAVRNQIDSKYTAFIAVNERGEKLTDIPELQDTVLEKPMGWNLMNVSFKPVCKLTEPFSRLFSDEDFIANEKKEINYGRFKQTDLSDEIDKLYKKIEYCERLIKNGGDYKNLLNEIIHLLIPYYSSENKQYKALFKKMKKKTPKVYDFIKPYLTNS